jgi:HEAT repeat protein
MKKYCVRPLMLLLIGSCFFALPGPAQAKDKKKKKVVYQGRTVSEWVGKLIYSKIDDKKDALNAIKAIGEPAVPFLIKNLNKRGAFYWCAAALGELGAKSGAAVPALISHLSDKDERNADKAYEVLRQIGPPSVPHLVKALPKQKNFKTKIKVIKLLGSFGAAAKDAVPSLAPLLRNKNQDMRKAATLALGNMGETAAAAAMKELNNRKSYVRLAAAYALSRMGASAKAAIPLLEARLAKEKKKDVKEAIENALGNIKS